LDPKIEDAYREIPVQNTKN